MIALTIQEIVKESVVVIVKKTNAVSVEAMVLIIVMVTVIVSKTELMYVVNVVVQVFHQDGKTVKPLLIKMKITNMY